MDERMTCLYRLSDEPGSKHELINLQHSTKVTFGRCENNDVILDESSAISRQHGLLQREGGSNSWNIIDLNSGNGIHLNNERLPPGVPVPLTDRDILEIGRDPCCSKGVKYSFQFFAKAKVQVNKRSKIEHEEKLKNAEKRIVEKEEDVKCLQQRLLDEKQQQEQSKTEHEEKLKDAQQKIVEKEKDMKCLRQKLLQEIYVQEVRSQEEKQQLREEMSKVVDSKTKEVDEKMAALQREKEASEKRLEEQLGVQFAEVLESELVCAICSELFIKATSLNCSHSFCKLCINRWMKNKRQCPQCRTPITSSVGSLVLDNYISRAIQHMGASAQRNREEVLKQREEEQKVFEFGHSTRPVTRPDVTRPAATRPAVNRPATRPVISAAEATRRAVTRTEPRRHDHQNQNTYPQEHDFTSPEVNHYQRIYLHQQYQNAPSISYATYNNAHTHHSRSHHHHHSTNPFRSLGRSQNQAGYNNPGWHY